MPMKLFDTPASDKVSIGYVFERWLFLTTMVHHHWAARVETAAAGWVNRTGYIPLKRDAFGLKIRVRHGYRRHERLGIGMFGI